MTPAERSVYLRHLHRAFRDQEVRSGTRKPGAMCEMVIWREGEAEREAWLAGKIAEAEHRQEGRPDRRRFERSTQKGDRASCTGPG